MYIIGSVRNCLRSGPTLKNFAITNKFCINQISSRQQQSLVDIRTICSNHGNLLLKDVSFENQRTVQEQFSNLDVVQMRHFSISSALNYAQMEPPQQQEQRAASNEKPTNEMKPREEDKKLTLWQRFKKMLKEYWYVLIPVHAVTSALWFGSFYYLAKSGININPLLDFVEYLGASEIILQPLRSSGAGYFAVAYALFKVASPARYTVTLGGTTLAITYLTRWGIIKPIMTGRQMKAMFHEKQTQLRSKRAQTLDKMNIKRKGSQTKFEEENKPHKQNAA